MHFRFEGLFRTPAPNQSFLSRGVFVIRTACRGAPRRPTGVQAGPDQLFEKAFLEILFCVFLNAKAFPLPWAPFGAPGDGPPSGGPVEAGQ